MAQSELARLSQPLAARLFLSREGHHPPGRLPGIPTGQASAVTCYPSDADAGDDPHQIATLTPYQDGPLIVRGAFRLVDQDGAEIDAGRRTVALCRCGRSARKPFCDGSHRPAGFRAPSGREQPAVVSRPPDDRSTESAYSPHR